MSALTYVFGLAGPAVAALIVVELVRARAWRSSLTWAWLIFALSAIVVIVFPGLLERWNAAIGLAIPREVPALVCIGAACAAFVLGRPTSGERRSETQDH